MCPDIEHITNSVWRRDTSSSVGMSNFFNVVRRSKQKAEAMRNEFADYFSSLEGRISYQDDR